MHHAVSRHPLSTVVRTLVLLAALAVLAACARGPASHGGPIHGDNKPHPGVDRARALPIQGLDVARYQGRIDFAAARAGGTHFVFIKGTEGKDYIDPNFYQNWEGARQAGVARGVYHFMTGAASPPSRPLVRAQDAQRPRRAAGARPRVEQPLKCKNKHNRAETSSRRSG